MRGPAADGRAQRFSDHEESVYSELCPPYRLSRTNVCPMLPVAVQQATVIASFLVL